MPAISSFNAMGWWPHCVVTNALFGDIANITSTSINTLNDSMKLWWLMHEMDVSYTISVDLGGDSYTASGSKTISFSAEPSERQCSADGNNVLSTNLGEVVPINEDNLGFSQSIYASSGEAQGTYFIAIYLTSFTNLLYSPEEPPGATIVGESKEGYNFVWQTIPFFGVVTYSVSTSIDSLTFYGVS